MNKIMKTVCVVFAILSSYKASAALIASESFSTGNGSDYTDNKSFTDAVNKANITGTVGFTADWSTGTALIVPRPQTALAGPNFNYSAVSGSVDGWVWNKTYHEDRAARRELSSPPAAGTTVYMSSLVMRAGVTSLNTNDVTTIGFGTVSGGQAYSIATGMHVGIQRNAAGEYRRIAGIGGSLYDLGAATAWQTDQIIVKMVLNASGTETVSIGLVDGGSSTLSWIYENLSIEAWSTTESMNALVIQLDGSTNVVTAAGTAFDEVRLGTSLSDVTLIPEPATVGFVGAGALLMMIIRRVSLR